MEHKNIKLKIAYDGSAYKGWQKTGTGTSIEEKLEAALQTLLQKPVLLQAASRTDAGVHAQGQVVNFVMSLDRVPIDQVVYRLNCLLPKDIAVLELQEVSENFHPTLDCHSKEYHYLVYCGQVQAPHQRHYAWHYHYPLNLLLMREAASLFLGTHDFSALCNEKKITSYDSYIRSVELIEIEEQFDELLCFKVRGNNFLYKMVRNIVGTLVHVGRGMISLDQMKSLLEGKDRRQAGITAPAHGLTLYHVNY